MSHLEHDAAVVMGAEDLSRLELLPPELVYSIFSHLSPFDLVAVSATSRTLYTRASADHLWQALVQENVPGIQVRTPAPCRSFKALYRAHDPYWYLPKYKIWFADVNLTGRLIIVRYDPRRGCIEGYQLVAANRSRTFQPWEANRNVSIHHFDPLVQLHMDKTMIQLDAVDSADSLAFDSDSPAWARFNTINLRLVRSRTSSMEGNFSRSPSPASLAPPKPSRLLSERQMQNYTDSMYATIFQTRVLSSDEISFCASPKFPYGFIWPPPAIPSGHRVFGTAAKLSGGRHFKPETRPSSRSDLSDKAFAIKTWLATRIPGRAVYNMSVIADPLAVSMMNLPLAVREDDAVDDALDDEASIRMQIGQELATYATLDPKLYTPTKEKPFRGIWVGDYSGHGCEFLLVTQPDDETPFDAKSIQPREEESPDEFEKRKHDETVYRGPLEAVKLTGDPNVPRGEVTFRVADLGERGLINICQYEPFEGVRIVKSQGHVGSTGFVNDSFIESQLLLISHDRLAQYWSEFGHVSFLQRVDIDGFLAPA
ncbi:Putative protein of unknown function [Podospora comata]|uniref:F-box domain-containing protein n=1 Tax=Podospora comata TaxID=48703 RepID=A0ABY6SFH6_PODCO|nr:Putative protein of unknown function [Podospora comata]